MALDRQSIEKRDFPIGRRGYDPEAVDAHLSLLADELEAAKRAQRQRGDTLATSASEQVRLIVEAAEQSAADIEREADLEARRIRQDARDAAEKVKSETGQQARDHVQRVSEAATSMLERIDAMESELKALTDNLRNGATRVSSDLSMLQSAVGELRSSTVTFEPDPGQAAAAMPGAAAEPAIAQAEALGVEPDPILEPEPLLDAEVVEPDPILEPEPVAAKPADEEGARLIAFNMALNGTPREETEAYLIENFDLPNPQALLDDVYAQAGL